MADPQHFTISGDKRYIERVIENSKSIPGVLSIFKEGKSDTAAVIVYNPLATDIGAINKLLRQYRVEPKGEPDANG